MTSLSVMEALPPTLGPPRHCSRGGLMQLDHFCLYALQPPGRVITDQEEEAMDVESVGVHCQFHTQVFHNKHFIAASLWKEEIDTIPALHEGLRHRNLGNPATQS